MRPVKAVTPPCPAGFLPPYLGRYVNRITIANSRILSLKNGMVTFRYQHSDTGKWDTMELKAIEFLRRFLQHVLPDGFHKVR